MMEEGELAVFFRNNHFSTILKRNVREGGREEEREGRSRGGREGERNE